MKRFNKFLAALLVLSLCLSTFAMTGALASSKVRTTGSCHLRKGPGLGYAIRCTVPKGRTLSYKGSSKKDGRGVRWYKVSYNGYTGWVSSRYAYLTSSSSYYYDDDDDDYYYYGRVKTTGSVHIRTSPRLSAKSLGSVGAGVRLKYRGKTSRDSRGVKWYAVVYNGHNGWVSSRYARLS